MNEEHTILCVDDEENILNALKRLLRKEGYTLKTAKSGVEGLEIVKNDDIHLVICDQRMPDMGGTEFLAKVKDEYPDVIRVILTGYTDVDSISESVNKGHIYKFLLKPWNDQNLKLEIRQCIEQYKLAQTNTKLQDKIVEQNKELRKVNENLEAMVRERTKDLKIQNKALEISQAILEDLPIPVIGISSDLMIVMVNIKAMVLSVNGKYFQIGKDISGHFPPEIEERIVRVIDDDKGDLIKDFQISGTDYDIDIMSASGKFRGKGAVLAFIPIHERQRRNSRCKT
ncbi:MAG: response regulator [Desulfobacteraceae bacterium]|jgi:response regulator RpfG family c-di-GMP phosphodiesterase